MSDIKKSFSDLIGKTPLYAAEKFAAKAGANAQVLAKLEYFNPAVPDWSVIFILPVRMPALQ